MAELQNLIHIEMFLKTSVFGTPNKVSQNPISQYPPINRDIGQESGCVKTHRFWDYHKMKGLRKKVVNIAFKDYNVFRMKKIKKISVIVLISMLIIPQGLASSLKSDLCIEWIRGNSDSNIFCVMKSDHNERPRDETSSLWIKSPMECCGNMAGASPHSEFLTNLTRDPHSVRQSSITNAPVVTEFSGQTIKLYQESWVTTSDPPVKIFKEVNSYII